MTASYLTCRAVIRIPRVQRRRFLVVAQCLVELLLLEKLGRLQEQLRCPPPIVARDDFGGLLVLRFLSRGMVHRRSWRIRRRLCRRLRLLRPGRDGHQHRY